MSITLADFIEARLAEKEATASYAGPSLIAWLHVNGDDGQFRYTTVASGGGEERDWCADGREIADPAHVRVVYDPARGRREVAALRGIVKDHACAVTEIRKPPFDQWTGEPNAIEYQGECVICGWFDPEKGGCDTRRRIGGIWSDDPAYQAQWEL